MNNFFDLTITGKKTVAENVLEFEFEFDLKQSNLFDWAPGAHIELYLPNGHKKQYSLIETDIPQSLKIAVLVDEAGKGGSLFIRDNFQIGQTVRSSLPKNHFQFENQNKIIFIAGGIGITPFLSMAAQAEKNCIDWHLYFLGKELQKMAYHQDLLKKYPNKISVISRDLHPRLDVSKLVGALDKDVHVYACGPESLISEIENVMIPIDPSRVHVERFHPREIKITEPDHEFSVFCLKSNQELVVPADESIFMALDFEGIEIPGDCMEGTCGTCVTEVVEGEIEHRDSVLSASERLEGKKIMPCVSRAKGDRIVLNL